MTGQDTPIEATTAAMDDISMPEVPLPEDEFNFTELFTQLASRKWLIAKVTGIAILVGLVLCFVLPVRYTATTRIMPPQQTQSSSSMLTSQLTGPMSAMAGGGLNFKNPNDIYIGLLSSRPIADAIIQKFSLTSVYHTRNMTQARAKLAGFTKVLSEKNGFIAVSVTDTDKKRAAMMANAYTDELRTLTKTLAVTEASQRRIFYEEQLKQAKETLVAAAFAFQQVQQQKGLVQLDEQAKALIQGLATLRAQAAAKQVEVQALRSYSTEQNPDVQLAEKELATLKGEEMSLEQNNHEPGIAGLGLENVPSAGLEYLRAEHELQYQQVLYDMLMKQYDAARLDESKDAAIIQVVEPAIEPDQKSSPRRMIILAIFAIVGFVAGCVLARIMIWREAMHADPETAQQ